MSIEQIDQAAKHVGDAAAASVTVATLFNWLPNFAAAFTILWTAVRLWESKTAVDLRARITAWWRNRKE